MQASKKESVPEFEKMVLYDFVSDERSKVVVSRDIPTVFVAIAVVFLRRYFGLVAGFSKAQQQNSSVSLYFPF